MNTFSVIVTAGGTSSRFGNKNKLLEIINKKTVIEETVSKFLKFKEITEIIIPVNDSIKREFERIFAKDDRILLVNGGDTRQESVYKALQYITNDYVLIHDGARPLITQECIKKVLMCVVEKQAISVMTKTTDTIKEIDENGKIIKTIDRSKLYNTQTPQAFYTNLIKDAHEKLKNKSFTDDASMLEELNVPVYSVIGDYTNIKITTKSDLDFAKLYMK